MICECDASFDSPHASRPPSPFCPVVTRQSVAPFHHHVNATRGRAVFDSIQVAPDTGDCNGKRSRGKVVAIMNTPHKTQKSASV